MSNLFSADAPLQLTAHEQTLTRERLDGCIGCGCLSLERCAIYNADDKAAALGDGPRYLLGDSPSSIEV